MDDGHAGYVGNELVICEGDGGVEPGVRCAHDLDAALTGELFDVVGLTDDDHPTRRTAREYVAGELTREFAHAQRTGATQPGLADGEGFERHHEDVRARGHGIGGLVARHQWPCYVRGRASPVVVTMQRDWLCVERPLLVEGHRVVGLDEVGRGALAGPVFVGAVVVTRDVAPPEGLNDSKALSARQRERLVDPISTWSTDWAIGQSSADEVDEWGIRWAIAFAARRALGALRDAPTIALLDGPQNLLRPPGEPPGVASLDVGHATLSYRCLIRGDRTSATIAAASVVAKVHRDRLMVELAGEFPDYGWATNMGYGSPQHLEALGRLGPSPQHRTSWRLPAWRVDGPAGSG